MSENSDSYTRFENNVILISLIIGFIGSVVLFLLDVKPILVSIFLGTGIASLIYRFLGGTAGNSMQLGALKFTGTVAVLIGSAYFINQELARQESEGLPKEITIQPNPDNWVAIGYDGLPIDIEINETDQVFEKLDQSPFINLPLSLDTTDRDKYTVLGTDNFVLGVLDNSALRDANLFSDIEGSKLFLVTQRLKPFSEVVDLDPIPFDLTTMKYSGDYSRFQLLDDDNAEILWSGSIYRKQFEIIKLKGKTYFIGIVEVNHDFSDPDSMYAKFAFAEILKENK